MSLLPFKNNFNYSICYDGDMVIHNNTGWVKKNFNIPGVGWKGAGGHVAGVQVNHVQTLW